MIKVIDSYVIDTDGRQYVAGKLASRKVKDETSGEYISEKYIKDPWYHGTFADAVRGIARRLRAEAVKRTDGDLEAACKAIQVADMRLIKALGVVDEIEVGQKTVDVYKVFTGGGVANG